ncbi:MAG: hypothetical protein MZU91_00950 [Desulfosudis oleivorans]|nr:hypothetical protein [Desulfosudis oleivorans]
MPGNRLNALEHGSCTKFPVSKATYEREFRRDADRRAARLHRQAAAPGKDRA